MTMFVMTLGEMNYHDNFLPWDNLAFATLTNVLFIVLVLGMPIIMMNMLVRKRTLHHYRVSIRKDFIDFCAVRFNPFEQRLRFEFPKFQEMRNGTWGKRTYRIQYGGQLLYCSANLPVFVKTVLIAFYCVSIDYRGRDAF